MLAVGRPPIFQGTHCFQFLESPKRLSGTPSSRFTTPAVFS
jgi:hypothetical protein